MTTPKAIIRNYITINLFNTLAASFIWGVNTLFLLDAGLNNFEAFAANAFFTLGMVIFEIPTGVIADTTGRRASYLLGCSTLFATTIIYLFLWKIKAPLFLWAIASLFMGLGFTFFSGAVEAWLVDALNHVGFRGKLEDVFSKGQIANGAAMLGGTIAGGYAAEIGDLSTPYLMRIAALIVSFTCAVFLMKDIGFETRPLRNIRYEVKKIFKASIDNGLKLPHVRWMMLSSPFLMGSSIFIFYASQPLLLELYGDKEAYGVAGVAAALFAASQIFGGIAVPKVRLFFQKRTSMLLTLSVLGTSALFCISFVEDFWVAIVLLIFWSHAYSIGTPVKQAYLNSCIPSDQRATILSFDGLMGSMGGAGFQPLLGKSADLWGYPMSYAIASVVQVGAIPLVWLAGMQNAPADRID